MYGFDHRRYRRRHAVHDRASPENKAGCEVTPGCRRFAGLVGALAPSPASAALYPFVDVPSRYEYNPKQGTLHDYCTRSPDSWDRADFRVHQP